MDKPTILLQLDTDLQPSAFDRVVALDSGADQVLSYGAVKSDQVRGLVHGAIFTRGPKDLRRTAVFVGGNDMPAAEALFAEATRHFLPQYGLRVSVLLDPGGANTTAAAAVRAAARHLDLCAVKTLVLGATGPVGQRIARLLAGLGALVSIGSREPARAARVCDAIRRKIPAAKVEPAGTASELRNIIKESELVVAAGAAGTVLLPRSVRVTSSRVRVAIDLNAVPPAGIEGIEPSDKAVEHEKVLCYGALAIGAAKMKIHKDAIRRLFESNDCLLDAEEVYALASGVE